MGKLIGYANIYVIGRIKKNGKEFEEDLFDPGSGDNKIELKFIRSMEISRRRLCFIDSSTKYQ